MEKNFSIMDVSRELDRIAGASCMSESSRQAAKYASELLRAVRASIDLEWDTNAAYLHRIGCMVEPNEQLKYFIEKEKEEK